MTSEAGQSILRRKTSANPSAVGPSAMDTTKALRVSVARAGDVVLGSAVGVRKMVETSVLPEGLDESDLEDALLLRLADDGGSLALAMVCPQALGAIIEAMTLGTILPVEASVRTATAVDAVLVGSFLDKVLEVFGALSSEILPRPAVKGYQSQTPFKDVRAA